eukprot:TRINITY_DN46444_c0_g1_i1.p1 TRINITY_DN46444_c0_g1~~TRINITY_DN46444_c0_g1_i1.p1  ORF type:complete len:391 (-),score=69.37 TRINITY_DN46444_c0_g1_i1:277-1449(-)
MISAVFPRRMLVGGGSIKGLGQLLQSFQLSNPLVITDGFLASTQSGALKRVQSVLDESKVKYDVFTDTIPEPTVSSIDRCVAAIGKGSYDSIVALGGGSPMDTAKAAAVLHTHKGIMRDYKAPYQMDLPSMPIIAIPTTAGTGSEATKFTIVTDETKDEKMLCIGAAYMPVAAIVDYEFTLTKPFRLTADTGIDAMCHAMEAYVSRKANPVADTFALEALRHIGASLRTACHDGQNRKARERMMLASTQAGMAFSNSSVTLIHGMSRCIGANFHVPHGLSNAMLAPLVTKFSIPGAVDRYADVARALNFVDNKLDNEAAAAAFPQALIDLTTELKVPTLQEFGVQEDKFKKLLSQMAADAIASGSPNNNPIIPSNAQVADLYNEIWEAGK